MEWKLFFQLLGLMCFAAALGMVLMVNGCSGASRHTMIKSGLQKYYVVRTYFNDLEQKFCAGCCGVLKANGLVEYSIGDGYMPVGGRTIEGILDNYRAEKYRD